MELYTEYEGFRWCVIVRRIRWFGEWEVGSNLLIMCMMSDMKFCHENLLNYIVKWYKLLLENISENYVLYTKECSKQPFCEILSINIFPIKVKKSRLQKCRKTKTLKSILFSS